jgi:hypothetical protein
MKAPPITFDKYDRAYVTINGAKHPLDRNLLNVLEARMRRDPSECLSQVGHLLAIRPGKAYGSVLGVAFSKQGGQARAQSMSSEQRTELARKAANARWNKQ